MENLIGTQELTNAATGHIKRMGGGEHLEDEVLALGVVVDEFQACMHELQILRMEGGMTEDESAYWCGGVFDGFIIGVRAARDAYGDLD